MKCTYKLSGGDKNLKEILSTIFTETEISYEALYEGLKKISNDKFLKGITDIVFSEKNPVEATVEKLSKIEAIHTLSRGYDKGNEFYDKSDKKGIIDLHSLIESGRAMGEDLVVKYDEKALKKNLIAKEVSKGLTQEEAEEKVDKLFDSYEKVEKYSYYLHAAINLYFKGNKNAISLTNAVKDLIKKNNESSNIEIGSPVINHLIKQLKDFEDYVSKEFGIKLEKGKNIFANFGLIGDIENSDQKIYSNIDLIVVDDSGTPHIFLFKSSIKSESEQDKIKMQKRDFYLGFNRQLLEAQGIDVSRTKLCIVPMKIKLSENTNELSEVQFESVDDRIKFNRNGNSDLSIGGRVHSKAKSIIKTTIAPIRVIGGISDKVAKSMSAFFPTRDLKFVKDEMSFNHFLKYRVQSISGAEHFYEFTSISGDTIKIKSPDPKESNVELKDAIEKELTKIKENRQSSVSYFIGEFEKVVRTKRSIDTIKINTSARGNLNVSIGKYTDGTWEIPKGMDALEELGIVLLQNKHTKQIDLIVLSNELITDLTTPFSLGLGDNILGCFKKNSSVANNKNLLKATNGNIELIKVMAALNELANIESSNLSSYTIGEIKAINVFTGVTNPVQPSMLRYSFNALCKESNIKNNTSNLTFLSDVEILKTRITSIIETVTDNTTYKKVLSDFEDINLEDKLATTQYLIKLSDELESKYRFLKGGYKSAARAATTTEENAILDLYLLIQKTIAFINGEFHQTSELSGSYGSVSKGTFLNGRLLTTADVVPDENAKRVTNIVRGTFTKVRHDVMNFHDDLRNKTMKPFEKAKGHTTTEHILVGNQTRIFKNLFRQTNGVLDSRMLFKNPYEGDSTMTVEEKTFLKDILWRINKRRFNLTDPNSNEAKKAMATEKWFWVPLVEAETSSKLTSSYLYEKITEEGKNIISGIERTKRRFTETEEGLYSPEEIKASDEYVENYKVLNRFNYSETNEETRKMLLNSQVTSFWETNIETLLIKYEGAFIRKENLDAILPIVKSITILTELYGDLMDINTEENITFLNNFVKQAVHNKSTLNDDEKAVAGYIKKARTATSILMIASNITAPIRDTMEGVWKTLELFIADTWGKGKGFGKKDYIWAMQKVLGDNMASLATVTMCEALNLRFGIANVDINVLEARAKFNKTGILNFRDKIFWTATAGDYFNRMVLFLAKMHHDGCFEACSFENGFEYNWKKDKRFEIFASGKTTHPKYKEQQGLYYSYLREFADAGFDVKDGNLPMPYSPNEVNIIKSFADRMYGYYDHEVRMQAERTALGSIFYQFSTWITAAKTTWFLPRGDYDQSIRVHKIDEATGKPLYWKEETQPDGTVIRVTTTENTGIPVYDNGRTYMEGIFYTLYDFVDDFRKYGLGTAVGNIKDVEVKRQNLKAFAFRMAMWGISAFIVKYLVALWKDSKKELKADGSNLAEVMGIQSTDTFMKALNGSFGSYDLISAFGGDIITSEPPMISMMTKMATSTWRTATDEGKDLSYWLKTNVAAYRSVSELVEGVSKLSEA